MASVVVSRLAAMAEPSVFTRIINREIPVEIILENDRIIAFPDVNPRAELHVLIVPKDPKYPDVTALAAGDPELLAEIVQAAKAIAEERAEGDFRLIFNNGELAGQTVFHVHAHVLAGETLREETLA